MQVKIQMDEREIRDALAYYIYMAYAVTIKAEQIHIEVKSKQNYKSEWEQAVIKLDCSAEAKKTSL